MENKPETREQLLTELARLRQRVAELEALEAKRRRAEEEIQKRTAQLEALREVGLELTAELNLDDLLHSIVSRAVELVRGDSGGLYLYRPDRDVLEWAMTVGSHLAPTGIFLHRGQGLSGRIWETGKPLIVNNYWRWEGRAAVYDGYPFTAVVGVPVRWGKELLGVLNVLADPPRTFSPADAELLSLFTTQAAIAIRNAHLLQTEREQRELAEALEEAAAAVNSTLEINEVLDRILEQVGRVIPGDAANVMLVESESERKEERDLARIVRWRGYEQFGAEEFVSTVTFRVSKVPNLRQMVESREPLVIPDTATYSDWVDVPVQRWLRSYAAAPIVARGEVIGFLNADSATPGFFSPAHARTLQVFASHAATAIQNAQLYQETARRLAQTQVLREVMLAAASSLDFGQVLERTIDVLERTLGIEYLGFMLPDEGGKFMKSHPSMLGYAPPGGVFRFPTDQCVTGRVYRTGQPVILPDVREVADYAVAAQEVRSELIVPVKMGSENEVVAVLNLESSEIDAFDEEDLVFYTAIAGQLGVAMQNARLYQELQGHAELLEERVKERTAEIQSQYARLEAVLNSTADGIVVTDAEGEILRANPVAQTWLTHTLSPEDGAQLREAVRELATRADEQPETTLELTGLDLELKAAPVSEPGGEDAAAVVAIHDVSHLKALDRIKTRFVTNISHELRTPVTSIKSYTYLMQRTPPEAEKWGQYLDTLSQEVDQLAQLVEDILLISRIYAGRLDIAPRPTRLNELAEVVIVSHQIAAQARDLTLEYHPAEPGPVALVDPRRLVQALNNLVENAIRYTSAGGRVTVSTGKEEAEGQTWATATVADTGIGIPEEELSHIFDRLSREEEPRSTRVSGAGLELVIVKGIVELHGGRVTVESPSTLRRGFPRLCSGQAGQAALRAGEEGEGSTFTVWLPLAELDFPQDADTISPL